MKNPYLPEDYVMPVKVVSQEEASQIYPKRKMTKNKELKDIIAKISKTKNLKNTDRNDPTPSVG